MNSYPKFLRPPDPPRASQHPDEPITQRELVELWTRVGVIQRARIDRRISRSDMIGIMALVAALAFSLGYFLAS